MDMAPEPLSTGATRVAGARERRWLELSIAVVVAAMAIAMLKPWGAASPPREGAASLPAIQLGEHAAVAAQSGLLRPDEPRTPPADAAERICGQPVGWRVVSSGLWQGRRSDASIALTPVTASAPTDGRIPFVVADGDRIDDLGWCSPTTDVHDNRPVIVAAWRLDAALPRSLVLHPVDASSPSRAGLYAPTAARPSTPWAAGRYVFRVYHAAAEGQSSWFGVEVRIQPVR